MKTKLLFLSILAIVSLGFFFLGWQIHQPTLVSTEGMEYVPNFNSSTPYLALTYDWCPPNVSVPEEYTCIDKLAYSILDEADILADKLMQAIPSTNDKQIPHFYDSLHESIQSAQKARDAYFDAVCNMDTMLIYGGTGTMSEHSACMYYYANQYLNTLKSLEKVVQKG